MIKIKNDIEAKAIQRQLRGCPWRFQPCRHCSDLRKDLKAYKLATKPKPKAAWTIHPDDDLRA
jgi:hypothetical protein